MGVFEKIENFPVFPKNTQNCFAHNSATKYRSEAVLFSERTVGYLQSPHIKTITVAFIQAELYINEKAVF